MTNKRECCLGRRSRLQGRHVRLHVKEYSRFGWMVFIGRRQVGDTKCITRDRERRDVAQSLSLIGEEGPGPRCGTIFSL